MSRRFLAVILFTVITLAILFIVLASLPVSTVAAPTYMGSDWDINNGDVITRADEEIILAGDLTVHDGGLLTLRNVTLLMDSTASTRYHIEVEDGGRLNIYDGDSTKATTGDASLITANDTSYNYAFYVRDGGELYFNDSQMEECGVANPLDDRGLYLESSTCTIEIVDFSDCYYGVISYLASPSIEGCTFTDINVYGAYLYTSSTDIKDCVFDTCGSAGVIAYYSYPKVTDSTFDASGTYGIYIYNAQATISGCTITDTGAYGIITQYNTVSITNTDIDDATTYGIYTLYSTVTISDSNVNDAGTGIYLYRNAAGSSLSGGVVGNCSTNGIYVYLTPATVSGTQVYDSTTNGIYLNRASGTMSNLHIEDAAVGLYVRDSTSTITNPTVIGGTTNGIEASGGSPTISGFSISSSATGLNAVSLTNVKADNGTITGATSYDVDVASGAIAELANVAFSTSGSRVQGAASALRVFWFVDLHGEWQDGTDIAGGAYTVTDQVPATIESGTLDSSGMASWLRIRQLVITSGGTTLDTPHSFTVSSDGLSGMTVSTIDTGKTVTVTVTDNTPPTGYAMNSESVYTQGTYNTVSWTAGTDAGVGGIEYYCQMATDAGFATVIYGTGWMPSLTYTFIGLADGTTYHYHVRAMDAVGNLGTWSSGVSSTQDSSPPSVPVVVMEPAYTQGTSNTVTWGTSSDGGVGGVQYQLQHTDDPTFNTVLGTSAWQSGTSRTTAGLTDGTTYYYHVKARDGFGQESAWTSPVYSTQDNSPPTRPNIVTEPTYTLGLSNTIEWLATTDAGVGDIEYYVEYDTASWFPSPDGNSGWIPGLSHTFNGLPENTWLYFRVQARDALGQASAWSSPVTWSRQDNSAPTVPVMVVEPTYTSGNSNTVSWAASSDGAGSGGIEYWVETDTTPFFTSPDFSSGWTTLRTYSFSSLVDGQIYYFRVKARDALAQESSWSSTVSSTQDASAPPIPSVATEPTYTSGTTNTIDWTAVTDAGVGGEQYQLEASLSPVFATTIGTSGWIAGNTYTVGGLSDGVTYYYRVRSRDSFSQVSDWSGIVASTQDNSPPPAPTMLQDEWWNTGLYYVAMWTAVTDTGVGGVEYYAEYDDLSNFASPNGNSGWISGTQFNFTGLQENRWYYYHVKARDALGRESGWSAPIFARQDNTAPTVPTMTAEPTYTAGNTNTVSWSASSDTGGIWSITYQVEVGLSPSFSPALQTSPWVTSRSFTFTGLSDASTYYYHVRAKDGLDNTGAWSAVVASIQDASPPPAPTMSAEPTYTQGTSNTVTWTAVTDTSGGTVQYRVFASASPVFATTEGDSGWITTNTRTFSGLTDGTTYYYRVHARDQFLQKGAWSNIVSSTQDAIAPTGYFMLAEPAYTQGTTNTVEWNPATDPGSGDVEYQCEVWTISTTAWISQTSYTFTSLPENTYIYYRVRARDAVGNTGGWSAWVWSRQDASAPSVPTMSALAQYSQGTSMNVGWSASSDGAGIGQVTYKVQYAASGSFSPALGESLWQSERTYTFSGLADGQTYYFRARSRDGLDQESGWSGWVSTTMDSQAPQAPFLAAEPAYTQGTSNTLLWSAVTDSGVGNVQYEIQASTSPTFTTVAATSGWISGTSRTFTGLTDGAQYFYRVHARDGFRQESSWSNVERSTQDATAPSAPTITTEPTYTQGTTNTIYWNAVTDASSGDVVYYVEYDDQWWFPSPADDSGWITSTEYTFTGIAENTWFYYRVRARDAAGNEGAVSALTWSRQDNTAPTTPTMSAEPTYTQGTTNAVSWSTSTDTNGVGGITYKTEVALASNFATVLTESPWLSSTSWIFAGLVDGWTYYYRVRARDALDHVSSYSNVVFSTQDASAPTAPFLTAEPEFTSGTANTISWSAVPDGGIGGVTYLAQRSTTPTFSSVVETGWVNRLSNTWTGLSDGTTYYYRVKARDSFRLEGPWSNVERSTQDHSAPSVPNLPVQPTYTEGTSKTLDWAASTDAGVGGIEYWIEYDNDFLFRNVNGNSGWITGTEHTFTDLAENTWWFYRVRARDDFGLTSGWSSTRWSRQDASPPTTPSMRIEPAYTPGTSNQVQWLGSTDSGVGGIEYQVFCDNDATMQSPIYASGWMTGLSYTFAGLVDGVTYYYAVVAKDSFDHVSAASNVASSTQDNSPPSTPVMQLEPVFTQGTANTLAWAAAPDAGVGGVVYLFQWSTSSVFSTVTGEYDRLTGTTASVSGLANGVRYYYRVQARDAFSFMSPWSNIVWSTQDASAPPVPKMTEEPEFTEGTSNSVSWSEVTDAGVGGVEYYTEISTDGSFTNPIGSGWVTVTKWTWNNLADGSRYWYRVRAGDTFGQQSEWSAFVSSTQDDRAPGVPTLAAEPAFTMGTVNTISWSAVTDAGVGGVQYEVQSSMSSNFAILHASSGWITTTSYTFSGLSDGFTFYYRVRARDAFDHASAWSNVRSSRQDAIGPTQPTLAAEPEFTPGLSNTISWSASTDAGVGGVHYFAIAASDGAFTDIVGTFGWSNATSATFTGLSDGVTYYYRVIASDAFGYLSPWSSTERSTQDNSPPSRPVMEPEPEYTPDQENTVRWSLSIDTGIGGVDYYCEWDTTPAFPSPNGNSGWVPIREWTFTGLPDLQRLFYHVRARDALGQMSAWSVAVSSIQDNSPPSRPTLNDVPDFTKGRAITLSWNPAVDLGVAGVTYWTEWDDDPSFATPGGNSYWVASATHTFDGLPEHTVLYFRVQARDAFDHRTPWSPSESTTLDASPPTIPYLASEPPYTQGTTNRLEWSTSVDAGVGGVEYKVQATSDPTWTNVDKDSGWLRANGHTFSALSNGMTYYYRVSARDGFVWTSAWSPIVSSTQDASAPPVPTIESEPAHTEGLDNTLSWTEVADSGVSGVAYQIDASPVATFSTIASSSGWVMDTHYTFTGLSEGAPLYYRVRSRDGFDQRSSWSTIVSSTQDDSPPQVPFVTPEPAYTAGSNNELGWLPVFDAGVGGIEYLVEASTDAGFGDLVASSGWVTQNHFTFMMLGDGVTYHYRVRAHDAFGHESAWSSPTSSTQDAMPPVVAFHALPFVVSSPVLEVTGTVSDTGSGVSGVEFSDDGGATWQPATYGSGVWSFTWTGFGSGEHEVWARARDNLDNLLQTPAVAHVEVDMDAPDAAISSPVVNDTLTGLVPIQGTALDPHIARYNLYFTDDGVDWEVIVAEQLFSVIGGTLAIWDTRTLVDGEYQVILEVNDTSGRTTRTNVTVYLLNSDIEISPGDLFLSNPYPFKGNNITISASFRNSGTSRANDVRITIRDNGQILHDGVHDIPAGETLTVTVPYVVPDHSELHTIRAEAHYDDNPKDKGDTASTSYTGSEVIVEPFFDNSEWALFFLFVVVLVLATLNTVMMWKRRGMVAAGPATGLPTSTATFSSLEPLGGDQIQWDDDSF